MRKLWLGLATLTLAVFAGTLWLVMTAQGLAWVIHVATAQLEIDFEIAEVQGRLLGPLTLGDVSYRDEDGNAVAISRLELDWRPRALVDKTLHVRRLMVQQVMVRRGKAPAEPAGAVTMPDVRLPVGVVVDDARIIGVRVMESGKPEPLAVESLQFRGRTDRDSVVIETLEIRAQSYELRAAGQITPQGSYPLNATIDWSVQHPEIASPLRGRTTVEGDLNRYRSESFLESPAISKLSLEIADVLEHPRWQARLSTEPIDLQGLNERWPPWRLSGELRTAGQIKPRGDYPLNVTIDWSVQHSVIAAPLRGRSTLEGDLNRLRSESVFESPAISKLSLEIADVLEHPRWRARLSTEPIDLQGLNERWPPWRLSGELRASGDLEKSTVAGEVESEQKDWGVLSSAFDVRWAEPELRIDRLNIARPGSPATLAATGRVALGKTPVVSFDLSGDWRDISYPWQGPAEWVTPRGRFDAKGDMDSFLIHIDGMLSAPGTQSGEHAPIAEKLALEAVVQDVRSKPRIKATAAVPYLRIAEYAVNDLRADIDLDTSDIRPSHIDVSVARFQGHEQSMTDVQIRGSGRLGNHTLEILAKREESSLHIAGSGGWQDSIWTATLQRFDIRNFGSTGLLLSSREVRLKASQTEAEVQRACWRVFEGDVCLGGRWGRDLGWHADLDVDGLSVSSLGALWRPEVSWAGAVSGRASFSADADNVLSMTAHLGSGGGSVKLLAEEEPLVLSYRDVGIDAKIENNQLRGGIRGTIDDHGALSGKIAVDKLFDDTAKRSVEADLTARFTTLDSIRAVLPDYGVEGGELDAQLNVSGDLAQPAVRAVARISNAAVAVPQAGTRLDNINVKLESKDDSTIELVADARSGDGSLNVSGTSQFFDPQNWSFDLRITGADVQAVNLPEAKVIATPNLGLKIQPGRIDLGGSIRVDEATISPELAVGAKVTLSPDVVIVRDDTEPPAAVLQTHGRVQIVLGDNVSFAGYGLTGKLHGSVDIVQEPSKATLATGEITISNGVYAIYGRKLDISPGRLIFAGGAIDNPGIDARAVRKIDDVSVTASLRGTLRQPELSLTSEPAMSDTDMLSYLVLGRPANQIGGGDATLLLNAANTLLPNRGANGVTDRIKSTFGLETLAVETRQGEDQETRETSLVLGKYLTPRLYIAYAAGVASTLNVFRVRYELSKRWLLQTESSSQESGGDVLFKIER